MLSQNYESSLNLTQRRRIKSAIPGREPGAPRSSGYRSRRDFPLSSARLIQCSNLRGELTNS